jgi:hypothetical protein
MAAQATASTDVVQRTPTQEASRNCPLPSFLEQIKNALPGNVTPERFVRVTLTAIQQNPELVTVDRQSLFNSDRPVRPGRPDPRRPRGGAHDPEGQERGQGRSPSTCR